MSKQQQPLSVWLFFLKANCLENVTWQVKEVHYKNCWIFTRVTQLKWRQNMNQSLLLSSSLYTYRLNETKAFSQSKLTRIRLYVHTTLDRLLCQHEKLFSIVWTPYPICDWRYARRSFASLQKSAPESPFLSMNRGPVRYGFSAGAKAIPYNVNIA